MRNANEPPPIVKERVMAFVHEDAYQTESSEPYGPPVPVLTRLLNLLPGYGSRLSPEAPPRRRAPLRRRTMIFVAFLFGSLASAYGIGRISHVVQRADAARERVVERVRHTSVYVQKFVLPARAAALASAASTALDLQQSKASVMPAAPDELSIRRLDPMKPTSIRPRSDQVKPSAMPNAPVSDAASLDLSSLEGALYFMSDRTGQHFWLKPVNDVQQGKASIYWNSNHAEALFSCDDLVPTTDGQRYTLSYLLDDGTREQLLAFEAQAGGARQVTIHRTPGPHVVGAQLVLESGYKTGQTERKVMLAAASRLQNK